MTGMAKQNMKTKNQEFWKFTSEFLKRMCEYGTYDIAHWRHSIDLGVPNVLDFKVWRTNFEFLTFFSWSWQWCRKRRQITNLFWTTFLSINIQRYLNFGAFYYIIDNFSCCSKFKCLQETISPPYFVPQECYQWLRSCTFFLNRFCYTPSTQCPNTNTKISWHRSAL